MGILRRIFKGFTKPVTNSSKGSLGEAKVNSKLNPIIGEKVIHRQINNLILVDEYGKSHQIDHVEIRENGIFCIETKNYSGWIFGTEDNEKWTQCLSNNEKHHFFNPLKQNKSHAYHLSKALDNKYRINSIVVMVQNNADKIKCSNVINLNNLRTYLKNFNDGTKLSTEEMDEIYNKLLANRSTISDKKHVDNVRQTQEEFRRGICPRCGGMIVIRKGKYGAFYGCNNYPKCTFTLKK